jgi:hypothetical protein
MHGPPAVLYHDELELMEDTSGGDYLDNITPALVSKDRFKRHHQWFEEVFSSLHSTMHILPEDLGFGLVGELGELTKGILDEPARRKLTQPERMDPGIWQDPPINTSSVYKPLDAEKLAEFEQRVAKFVESKNKEMDEMREKHAKTVARINKGRFYMDAEERLKEAGLDTEKMDAIVREVELKMGISLQERMDVVCVQKGALEDDEKHANGNGVNGALANGDSIDDAAEESLDEFATIADFSNSAAIARPAETDATALLATGGNLSLDVMDRMDLDTAPAVVSATATTDARQLQLEGRNPTVSAPTISGAEASASSEQLTMASLEAGDAEVPGTMVDDDDLQADSIFDTEDFSAFDGVGPEESMAGAFHGVDGGLLDFEGGFGDDTADPTDL